MVLSAFVLISGVLITSTSSLTCPSQKDAKVLIFGAGTAGVTAARVLNDHGLNSFKVLEAYDKIGGRIRNIAFKGVQIEVGANWIHEAPEMSSGDSSTANINPIWALTHQAESCYAMEGNEFQGSFTDTAVFRKLNTQQNYEIVAKESVDGIVTDYLNKYHAALQNTAASTVRKGLDSAGWDPDSALKQLVEWSEFDFTYATTPEKSGVSLTAKNHNVNFGDQCFIVTDQRGFASMLRCMANFDHQNKILTNTVVTSIDWNDECVCAEVMGQGRMCGDYGIVTFSIGVLQNWIANNKFRGSLSTAKMTAITHSKMGLYLKIFIRFQISNDDVFWDTSASYTYATNTERGYYPVLQPIGASLPGSPPIILMTLTGDEAMRISDLGSNGKDKVREEVVSVLRKWYNIEDEMLLTITNDDIEYYDWNTDEFFLGMFSNNPTTLTIDDKRNLAMPEGRLYFSGEANSIEHGGTIHGAYCSGMDAATKILTAKGMYNEASNSLPKCSTSSGCSQESSKKQTCPTTSPTTGTTPMVPSSAKGWSVSTFTLASVLLAALLVCGA